MWSPRQGRGTVGGTDDDTAHNEVLGTGGGRDRGDSGVAARLVATGGGTDRRGGSRYADLDLDLHEHRHQHLHLDDHEYGDFDLDRHDDGHLYEHVDEYRNVHVNSAGDANGHINRDRDGNVDGDLWQYPPERPRREPSGRKPPERQFGCAAAVHSHSNGHGHRDRSGATEPE